MPVRARLVVKGMVQGVGYRWFVTHAAHGMGITGWVRNLPDGSVEVVCEARDQKGMDDFIERLRKREAAYGPTVTDIIIEPYGGPVGEGFEIAD